MTEQPDWIERLRNSRPYDAALSHDAYRILPLLCDVVEAAGKGALGTEPELDRAVAALRAEVERNG